MELKVLNKKGITEEQFKNICKNNSVLESMILTELPKETFRKYAKYLNCYFPNQGGKGKPRPKLPHKFDINKWNNNELIIISRRALKTWIEKLNLLPCKCNKCGLDKWLEEKIPLELNHINGKGHDNRKNNLEFLCPNCHALTDTYRGKNK